MTIATTAYKILYAGRLGVLLLLRPSMRLSRFMSPSKLDERQIKRNGRPISRNAVSMKLTGIS